MLSSVIAVLLELLDSTLYGSLLVGDDALWLSSHHFEETLEDTCENFGGLRVEQADGIGYRFVVAVLSQKHSESPFLLLHLPILQLFNLDFLD